jgi:hydrogenase maturation protein HypF
MNDQSLIPSENTTVRLRVTLRGAVQGVGFRPFVYRLASELALPGWVSNTSQGVAIEVESVPAVLGRFLQRLRLEIPPRAFIQSFEHSYLDPRGFTTFEIRESLDVGKKSAIVLPDIATCPDCLREILDPTDRRFGYPFTNCTNCGPRFSIIESLPYDRPSTSMKMFRMCSECEKEYRNPTDRRFHAQPNACSACGPNVEYWEREKAGSGGMECRGSGTEALQQTATRLRRGEIVAVKGLGGFQLLVDARNRDAVTRLRERKRREEKPFAVMVPDLETAKQLCEISADEERLLLSPEAPIVIIISNRHSSVATSVSPLNPTLGLMLPYTPLHHLLMRELCFPVVATSGNLSDEPICIDEREAFDRLGDIADAFLVHDRPIVRHVDDSVVRVVLGREQIIRRARGYAPLPIEIAAPEHAPTILALGPHQKNTVVLATQGNAFISQHIGDLETAESLEAFRRVSKDLQDLYESPADVVACDLHPEYLSSKEARYLNTPIVEVQHHHAHILSCMAENQISGEVLGVAWDGTGFGSDGTIWGGEFLRTNGAEFERVAHFRQFRLPGGDAAVKEPRRSALGVLEEMSKVKSQMSNVADLKSDVRSQKSNFVDHGSTDTSRNERVESAIKSLGFTASEQLLLLRMLEKGINSPWTSSVGRLFDAVAAIVGIRKTVRHEGQAAMELEWKAARWREGKYEGKREGGKEGKRERGKEENAEYRLQLVTQNSERSPIILDWAPMIRGILDDAEQRVDVGLIALKFHQALIESVVAIAKQMQIERVVLSGGCFQNVLLTEGVIIRLREEGFRPYWHQRVPTNDGGIALGQAYAALLRSAGRTP